MCCALAKRETRPFIYAVSLSLSLWLALSQRLELQTLQRARILLVPAAISVAHLARNNSIFPPGSNACRALCHALPRCSLTLLSTDVFANNQFYTHELFRCETAERTRICSSHCLFQLPFSATRARDGLSDCEKQAHLKVAKIRFTQGYLSNI